jgi:MFS family permease
LREAAGTFWVNPRRHPDYGWAWWSRFLIVLAYAFLTTYQTFYLMEKIGSNEADVPGQVFLGTLLLAGVSIVSSVGGGKLSDVTGRRKVFVIVSALIYGAALVVAATATDVNGFLIAMTIAGVGFGAYSAVDIALVTDVLPSKKDAAKDMGVFNIASTLPQALAPAIAPIILSVAMGSYTVLFIVAGVIALVSAALILPVRKAR